MTQQHMSPAADWVSPIDIDQVFAQPAAPAYPFCFGGERYFQQALADEGGRNALMVWREDGAVCLLPAPFNLRSQVHEYGGKCFCLIGGTLVFNNFADGRLYQVTLGLPSEELAEPKPLTEADDGVVGFADLVSWTSPVTGRQWVVAVVERPQSSGYNLNDLVAVCVDSGRVCNLATGADFYASPALHQNQIAWMQWQLPDMPWDRASLWTGALVEDDGKLSCSATRPLVDAAETAVCQVGFLQDGSLVAAWDAPDPDWWNLHRCVDLAAGEFRQLSHFEAEVGAAHWVFGQRRWLEVDGGIVCIATNVDGDRLIHVPLDDTENTTVLAEGACMAHLESGAESGKVMLVLHPEDRPGAIIEVDCAGPGVQPVGPQSTPLLAGGYAAPVAVHCEVRDGEQTHGYYYAPWNPDFALPAGTSPPLVVMVHGGPTARSDRSFHPLRQYLASLGFAILDVNHRGSTGHGRRYRQRLLGGWGEIDATDIADLTRAMVDAGRADGERLFIRGGSAGGYAVLRGLTRFPDLFAGGACYYGIGNLITLSEITHKFEGKYTDGLVGEPFDAERARQPDSLYVRRSPLFEMDRLRSPVILFQGLKDKVVPPEVTREVVALLEGEGVPHEYVEYPDEGHGFRALDTRVDSLKRETRFFRERLS